MGDITEKKDVDYAIAKSFPWNTAGKIINSKSCISYSIQNIFLHLLIKLVQHTGRVRKDHGKRVHERGGAKDDIMYNLTLLIIIIGGVEWCRVVYKLAFPSKG